MKENFFNHLTKEIAAVREAGLYKDERVISSPQDAHVISNHKELINLCSNNYLGLSNHPTLVENGKKALDEYGFGLSSVRFICGTQSIHKELEKSISDFLETEDTILYSSCFDANAGLFETLFGPDDAIISDALNHASIIDGIRLCKAKRYRYANNNMEELEERLKEASGARFKIIVTDGVFSMDGIVADLSSICDLADKYQALVMVDDSHAVGFMGQNGKGTHEECGVIGRVDIITGTLGKALGGASGGYTSGNKVIIEWLRQRSRPYLFSNSLAPMITKTSVEVLNLIQKSNELRDKLKNHTKYFRNKMKELGFNIIESNHPIVPIMLGDAILAQRMSEKLLEKGIYVVGFSYPVVPQGQARIRTQMSAALSQEDIDRAIKAFEEVGRELKVIK